MIQLYNNDVDDDVNDDDTIITKVQVIVVKVNCEQFDVSFLKKFSDVSLLACRKFWQVYGRQNVK